MFYIGSSFLHRIIDGYIGTPSSRKWKTLWNAEKKSVPYLFSTKIVCVTKDRNEALLTEARLQRALSVAENPLYLNEGYANKGFHNASRKRDDVWKQRLAKASRNMSEQQRRSIGEQARERNRRIWVLKTPAGDIIETHNLKTLDVNVTSLHKSRRVGMSITKGKSKGWQLMEVKRCN